MRCLLDTHAIIWYFEQGDKLSATAEKLIDNPRNTIYVSVVSLWEIAIKSGIGKLDVIFDDLLERLE